MPVRMDLHVHSTVSPDEIDSIMDMCCEAIDKNIKIICFTDHINLERMSAGNEIFDFANYSRLIDKARARFGSSLKILKGLEVGEIHLHQKEFEKIVKFDFDMVMGAIHKIGNHFV